MRVRLQIPTRPRLDKQAIERRMLDIGDIKTASFNNLTGSLLIKYNQHNPTVFDEILDVLKKLPLTSTKGRLRLEDHMENKKRDLIVSGILLLSGAFIPRTIKPFLALKGGFPFIKKGLGELLKKRLNSSVLDSSAIIAALLIKDYKTSSVISFLLRFGEYLELWTKKKTQKSLTETLAVGNGPVWILKNGREIKVPLNSVKKGDLVVLRAGCVLPVDGVVSEGVGMVNQSSMTGESLNVVKGVGTEVFAGTILDEGHLTVSVTHRGDETRISKVIKIIEESQHLKADIQSYSEQLADKIVPLTFVLSIVTYIMTGSTLRATSVFLVDYSCALKLSTPLTIMSALIELASGHTLVKGGKVIENLARADVFVFDKTGTVTEAVPTVLDIITFNGFTKEYVLRHAACVGEHYYHPLTASIAKKAEEVELCHDDELHEDVENIIAHGIVSEIDGRRILIGSRHFIYEDEGITIDFADDMIREYTSRGNSVLYVAIEDRLAALIILDDPLRKGIRSFMKALKKHGVKRFLMLTGDCVETASRVAESVNIDEYYAQILPDKKSEIIQDLKRQGHTVVMLGDGINDSPALSVSDVGVSMKHGAEITREIADIVLLDNKFEKITHAKNVSIKAMKRVKNNFGFIISINTVLIGLSIFGISTPVFSAFAHNAATIATALNSLRPYGKSNVLGIV